MTHTSTSPRMSATAALTAVAGARGTMSCQYALILLRWLDRAPEDFLRADEPADVGDTRLPSAGAERRLRWDLPLLHRALDERRRSDALTWVAVAGRIGCTASRLTNLRTARLADMDLARACRAHWPKAG